MKWENEFFRGYIFSLRGYTVKDGFFCNIKRLMNLVVHYNKYTFSIEIVPAVWSNKMFFHWKISLAYFLVTVFDIIRLMFLECKGGNTCLYYYQLPSRQALRCWVIFTCAIKWRRSLVVCWRWRIRCGSSRRWLRCRDSSLLRRGRRWSSRAWLSTRLPWRCRAGDYTIGLYRKVIGKYFLIVRRSWGNNLIHNA